MKTSLSKITLSTVLVLSFILVISSCSSDGEEIEQPEQIYYNVAQSRMKANNFFSAIEALEMIENRYPFGRDAEQAQSELIYAYYMNREDEASHAAAEKFIRLHPRHPNIDYAYFMRGLASYTRDKTLFARLFNSNLEKRDISGAKQSFAELTEFLTRFPESQYAPYANQRLVYLRNLIAKHELVAADYYIKRGAYIAALRRAKYVLENIPNSSEDMKALKVLETCYEELGYLDLLEDVRKIIVINKSSNIQRDNKLDESPFKRSAPKPETS